MRGRRGIIIIIIIIIIILIIISTIKCVFER
jgi:hypothetical protein